MKRRRTCGAALLLVAAGAGLARADKTVFNPSIALGSGYTDNVTLQDGADSDRVDTLEVTFPWERETRRARFRAQYQPTFYRYRDAEALDRDDHRFDMNWSSQLNRRTRASLFGSYSQTLEQGTPFLPDDPDLYLTPRAERRRARVVLRLSRQQTERWGWDADLSGYALEQDVVEDLAPPGTVLEDRSTLGASLRGRYRLSSRSQVGARYGFSRFDLDQSGEEDAHRMAFTYIREVARRLELEVAVGAFRSTGTAAGVDEERTGATVEVFLTRSLKDWTARLDVAHEPSAGGSLDGTATRTSVGLLLRSSGRAARWIWRFAPRIARRDPTDETLPTLDTYGVRAQLERKIGWRYGVRASGDWFDQEDRDAVTNVTASFVWYPIGATELGGRTR